MIALIRRRESGHALVFYLKISEGFSNFDHGRRILSPHRNSQHDQIISTHAMRYSEWRAVACPEFKAE